MTGQAFPALYTVTMRFPWPPVRIPWYARILGRAFALYALYKALRGRPLRFNYSNWRERGFTYSMDFDRSAKVRHEFGH